MYSTCIFCHSALGDNQVIEHFPVGKRLAFDATKGRLWVVCTRCRQWNLSPLEERWEAIEEGERLFRATHLRVSTDQIGLARAPDGTELIRIGAPQRPEMAAWRYGPRFAARWKIQGRALAAAAGVGTVMKSGAGGALLYPALGAAAFAGATWFRLIAEQVKRRRLVTQFTGPVTPHDASGASCCRKSIAVGATGAPWRTRFSYFQPRARWTH